MVISPQRSELEGVRALDAAAMASFFDRYFDRLYALARHLTGSVEAAEDLAQETFLRVQRAAARLDPGRDPWPWLVTIAVNLHRDGTRSFAERVSRSAASLENDAAVGGRAAPSFASPEPWRVASTREDAERVRAALHELPLEQRTAVLLRDFSGLAHEEVAAAMGATPVAARKCYSRALDALARVLARMRT